MSMKFSDAEKLLELGLISREQRDAIVAQLKLSPATQRNYLLITLSGIGGLLVLAGAILLVSANWEEIPALAKQVSAAALMLAFWIFGLRLVCRKANPRPIPGEALCFVGAGTWLANIALYGQIYQLSSEPSNAIAAWFLGIFAIPWLVRLRGVFLMSLAAAFIWLCCKTSEADYHETQCFYFHFLAFFTAVSALGIFLSGLADKARDRVRGYGPIAMWTAFPALIFLAQFFCYERWFNFELFAEALQTLVPASALLLGAMIFSFRKKLNACGFISAILLGVFPLFPLGLAVLDEGLAGNELIESLMAGALFAGGCAAMVLGAQVSRKFYINLGALMILSAMLAIIVQVVGSLTSSGLALISAGTFLLVFAYFLERQRRKMTAKIKEASL